LHEDLSKEELHRLVHAYAKSWLAHDGCWFLAVEEEHGLEEAIRQDERSWSRFAPLEARRVMEARGIAPGGGLEALAEALRFRMYSFLNEQEAEQDGDRLRFTMTECRVQAARRRKGLPLFPCKPWGPPSSPASPRRSTPELPPAASFAPPTSFPRGLFAAGSFELNRNLAPRATPLADSHSDKVRRYTPGAFVDNPRRP